VGRGVQKQLTHELLLYPRYFGRELHESVVKKLYQDVEGTCSPRVGYVVAVTAVEHVGPGRVLDGRGAAVFEVRYRAVVWRPYKDEVVDAVVTEVNDQAVFADVGPTTAVVHRINLPHEFAFQKNANPPCYQNADQVRVCARVHVCACAHGPVRHTTDTRGRPWQSLTVAKDSVVRIKILNVTMQSRTMVRPCPPPSVPWWVGACVRVSDPCAASPVRGGRNEERLFGCVRAAPAAAVCPWPCATVTDMGSGGRPGVVE
jgi:DNA-directed RNA polymerase II subunit RPB7